MINFYSKFIGDVAGYMVFVLTKSVFTIFWTLQQAGQMIVIILCHVSNKHDVSSFPCDLPI